MLRSREMQMGAILVVVAIVLSVLARVANWPNWLIVVLFVVAAAVTLYAWPGRRNEK